MLIEHMMEYLNKFELLNIEYLANEEISAHLTNVKKDLSELLSKAHNSMVVLNSSPRGFCKKIKKTIAKRLSDYKEYLKPAVGKDLYLKHSCKVLNEYTGKLNQFRKIINEGNMLENGGNRQVVY